MAKKTTIEVLLTADGKGFSSTMNKAQRGLKTFNKTLGNSNRLAASMRNQLVGLAGAFVGLQAVGRIGTLLENASKSAYALESSLKAANRQFEVGSLERWQDTIERLSEKLRIYSKSDLQAATARTVDMTKRLGMSADQMEKIIELSGDLSAGKTTLVGGIERVTAALRGEAEASEYLGLTLNETFVKSWYEARGAMQGAWKDLSDLEKAQVRYQVFLEQAIPLQGKAAESVETYAGAIALIKKTMSDGIGQNEDLVASLVQVAAVLNENADELGDFASKIATGAAKVIEFVAANRNLILWLGKWGLIMGVAVKALSILLLYTKAANAAMIAMTGVKMIPWLAGLRINMTSTAVAARVFAASLLTIVAPLAALYAGFKVGEWLAMRKHLAAIAESTRDLKRYSSRVAEKFKEISQATGVTVTSMDELDQAVAEGRLHYDDLTGAWVRGAGDMAQATVQSAETQKQAQVAAVDAMKAAYQKYVDEIKRLQDEIAGKERSLAQELREMARGGMSDTGAWNDRKKEAEEYARAAKYAFAEAKKALEIGDSDTAAKKFAEAKESAKDAKTAYKDLNKEVKEGETVTVSAQEALARSMAGVKKTGELAIEILEAQQTAAEEAADAVNEKSDWQLGDAFTEAGTAAKLLVEQAKDLNKTIEESGGEWGKVWDQMERDAKTAIDSSEQRIVALTRDREITLYINEVVRKRLGGLIHRLATGGKLAGYGGGDRIPALLEAGEYIIRKEAVSRFGAGIFHALNNLRLPALPGFATGGPVGAGGGGGQSVTINLYDHASGEQATVVAPTQYDYEAFERMQRKRARLASR